MADDERELAERAAGGDGEALRALLERHLSDVRAFVRLRAGPELRQHESSSDLVQSVCREILEHGARFRHASEDAFRRWLYTSVLRKIQNRRRFWTQGKRDAQTLQQASEADAMALFERHSSFASPSRQAMVREEVERVEEAFDELTPEHREVLTLAHVLGLSRREIGEQMGKSEEAVRALLHRAMVRLSTVLAQRRRTD